MLTSELEAQVLSRENQALRARTARQRILIDILFFLLAVACILLFFFAAQLSQVVPQL